MNDPLARIVDRGGSVLVVGLGSSGISAANLVARAGCRVEVSEKAERAVSTADLSALSLLAVPHRLILVTQVVEHGQIVS